MLLTKYTTNCHILLYSICIVCLLFGFTVRTGFCANNDGLIVNNGDQVKLVSQQQQIGEETEAIKWPWSWPPSWWPFGKKGGGHGGGSTSAPIGTTAESTVPPLEQQSEDETTTVPAL